MGWIKKRVRIGGIDAQGRAATDGIVVSRERTLFDTGASQTVMSSRAARRAGVVATGRTSLSGATGPSKDVRTGKAFLTTRGCDVEAVTVVIDDEVTRKTGADVIVGHDYMQRSRMNLTLSPTRQTVDCGKPRKGRKS